MNALSKFNNPHRDSLFAPFELVFDDFFIDFFKGTSLIDKVKSQSNYPKVDIFTEKDSLILKAAIPGFQIEDIQVEMIDDKTLEISAIQTHEQTQDEKDYHVKELSRRAFNRRINFKESIKEPISAILKDGILTITWEYFKNKPPDNKKIINISNG